MIQFLLFLLGASMGSFVNVISLRYNPDKNFWSLFRVFARSEATKQSRSKRLPRLDQPGVAMTGGSINRSRCPHCQKILTWYELIPIISFILQAGRCRACQKKLSWQYPIVEALMGLLAVSLYTSVFTPPMCQTRCDTLGVLFSGLLYLFLLLLLISLVTIALIDLRTTIIPDESIVVAFVLTILTLLIKLTAVQNVSFIDQSIGLLIGGGMFGGLWALGRGRWMGLGDAKLGAVLGLWLGFPGIILALALAFVSGTIVASGLLITQRKTLKDAIPFGPFLVLGAIAAFFLQDWWHQWWQMLGL